MSARPPRRRVNGVLLIDKPAGLTSNACLGVVKRLLNADKAGHTGTLDPFATGLLPVVLGEAAKFSQGLLEADKSYLGVMRLGVTTTTGDPEGEVIATWPVTASDHEVRAAMQGFVGAIQQVPPMHSALKRDGRPLYDYARAGLVVEREARSVRIELLEWLGRDGDAVSFRVACSKGTYVRTLAEDIGARLGCGAHLSALRREQVGPLDLDQALTFAQLETLDMAARDARVLPVDTLVLALPMLALDADLTRRLRLGQRIPVAAPDTDAARAYGEGGSFLGVVRIAAGVAHPTRLVGVA
ncbi:MAG: tRNA pseudouridine(55) synthase TruB [Burkholderiales bacterium]